MVDVYFYFLLVYTRAVKTFVSQAVCVVSRVGAYLMYVVQVLVLMSTLYFVWFLVSSSRDASKNNKNQNR